MEPKNSLLRALAASLTRERKAKSFEKADRAIHSFSITEKAIFFACFALFAGAALSMLGKVSDSYSVDVPHRGGTLVEGVVGTPRFVDPLLAASDADRDLTQLVFSGLMKQTPSDDIVPDLAADYSISSDGLVYTIDIRPDARFQDGTPVTADDVVYTVQMAQDPTLKSPRFVNWQGVSVAKTGRLSVKFSLKQAYAPFLDDLTLGILPSHSWKNLTPDQFPFSSLNTNAIGSGPYMVASVVKSSDGIPTEFILKSNPAYTGGEPYITNLYIKSYATERDMVAALRAGAIASAANLSPASAAALSSDKSVRLISAPLTRIFGIFFDQSQNEVLAHKEVREALDLAIDKNDLVKSVLDGYGTVIDGPLPPSVAEMSGIASASSSADEASTSLAQAAKVLAKAGWKKDPATGIYGMRTGKGKTAATTTLSITLSTANIPELVLAAKKIQDEWNSFGVETDIKVFEPSDLNQSVIRPRKYDALLFGLVTGKGSDLYPFWHSSQRIDPGLNIALYTNQKADKILESMRLATSSLETADEYAKLKSIIDADVPASFLWSPDFLYAVPAKLGGVELGAITTSSDRFLGVEKWYISTDRVWNAFVKDKSQIIQH